MHRLRVLVVDDAVVARRMVSDALSTDPSLEVVGAAANGHIAMARIPQLRPDVITLDVEMPVMDGLETLAAIRTKYPSLPVIMFSAQTQHGAEATVEALALGASDYLFKPSNLGRTEAAIEYVRAQLIPKIKLVGARTPSTAPRRARPPAVPAAPKDVTLQGSQRVDVVAIGASTGGPNALSALVPMLPVELPVPVLIVQHMPPLFTQLLSDRLTARSPLQVREGTAGEALVPGLVRLAPGDFHMTVARNGNGARVELHQGPPENSVRPAVDVLLRSLVQVYGAGVLAVVLTGMGQDGLRGCESVGAAGGQVLVQDEQTSVVWGMPGSVARAGLADRILPIEQVGPEILRRVQRGR